MASQYLGQITMVGFDFAPKGWALCNGQILPINQNQALFAVLGTTYGGNGTNNFGLPNLQSRLPLHSGQGLGLSPYTLGQTAGTPSVTLNETMTPQHNHAFKVSSSASATTSASPSGNVFGTPSGTNAELYANPPVSPQPPLTPVVLNSNVVGNTGGSQPHSNLMPSLCVTFVIALVGIFPSRN